MVGELQEARQCHSSQLPEAEKCTREALSVLQKLAGSNSRNVNLRRQVIKANLNLADILAQLGRMGDAKTAAKNAGDIARELSATDHRNLLLLANADATQANLLALERKKPDDKVSEEQLKLEKEVIGSLQRAVSLGFDDQTSIRKNHRLERLANRPDFKLLLTKMQEVQTNKAKPQSAKNGK